MYRYHTPGLTVQLPSTKFTYIITAIICLSFLGIFILAIFYGNTDNNRQVYDRRAETRYELQPIYYSTRSNNGPNYTQREPEHVNSESDNAK